MTFWEMFFCVIFCSADIFACLLSLDSQWNFRYKMSIDFRITVMTEFLEDMFDLFVINLTMPLASICNTHAMQNTFFEILKIFARGFKDRSKNTFWNLGYPIIGFETTLKMYKKKELIQLQMEEVSHLTANYLRTWSPIAKPLCLNHNRPILRMFS